MVDAHKNNAQSSIVNISMDSCLQLPFHVYLKDTRGTYVECNLSQAKSFGVDNCNDVIGRSDKHFHPQNEVKALRMNDLEIQKTEKSKVIIEQCTFADSKTTQMLSFKMPVRNNLGKVIGIFGTSIALDSHELLTSILPTSANLPFLINKDKNEIDANNYHPAIREKAISKREKECLQYLIRGMTAKEIARILNLSPRTIEFYIENMKKKFGCFNRTELVAKAFDIFKYNVTD